MRTRPAGHDPSRSPLPRAGCAQRGRKGDGATDHALRQWASALRSRAACPFDIRRSVQAIPIAEAMNTQWMIVCHMTPVAVTLVQLRAMATASAAHARSSGVQNGRPPMPRPPASMKLFSRWIELMPMIAIASLTLSTDALTWLSHSGWSG